MLPIYICLVKVRNIVRYSVNIEQMSAHWVGNISNLINMLNKCDSNFDLITYKQTNKGVFRTQLNIYGGAFLQKYLTTFSC